MTISEFINRIGFRVNEQDVDKVNNTIAGIKNTASRLLGAIGIGLSLTSANELVEEFTRVNNQIRNATSALGDFGRCGGYPDLILGYGQCGRNAGQGQLRAVQQCG